MTRPLVVRFGALGDMVLMTVAIRRLAQRYRSPVDVLGSGDWTLPLLRDQPGVGEIYLLRSRRRPYWLGPDQWRLVRRLRRRGAGPTWLFDARPGKTKLLLERAGWRPGDWLTLDSLVDIPGEHFCDHWQRLAELTPERPGTPQSVINARAEVNGAFPELRVPQHAKADLSSWLESLGADRYILIQAGNKRTMRQGSRQRASNTKYWPEPRWAGLLRGLRALHPRYTLLLLGVAPESDMNDEILAMAGIDNARNLAREMSVPRLMALSERALGMISVDTGPAHVAAALGCPVLALFDSPAKRTMYAPRGPGPAARCIVGGTDAKPSLLGITADAVLAAWRAISQSRARDTASGLILPEVGDSRPNTQV